MFTRLGCDGRPPRFRVEFYPYSSLVLTIRRREEVVSFVSPISCGERR